MKDVSYHTKIREIADQTLLLAKETIEPLYVENDYDEDNTIDELLNSEVYSLWQELDNTVAKLATAYKLLISNVEEDITLHIMINSSNITVN